MATSLTSHSALFGPNGRRADLVAAYHELDDACSELGFGEELTIGEWSIAPNWALVFLARAAHPPLPPPEKDWSLATIPELIADIVATHHIPLRHELERLEILINHLANSHPDVVFKKLRIIYHDFKEALKMHLDQEETELFPLCIELEEALGGRRAWNERGVTLLIRSTGHGHATCEIALQQILNVLQNVAATRNDPDVPIIRTGVEALARDLVMHTAKESEFLIPAAIFSEEQLRARCSTGRILNPSIRE